jgi:hypothetical protein
MAQELLIQDGTAATMYVCADPWCDHGTKLGQPASAAAHARPI